MEQTYRDAAVQTIVLRAGNFIDPRRKDDVMSLLLLRDLDKGVVTTAGDPDARHAYCYLPDWARAAVALAEKRAELASFEDIPFGGHDFTVNQLKQTLVGALGYPLRLASFPWWAIALTSPFWELAREMREMRYLWDTPHSLSETKLARLLPGFRSTPLASVMLAAVNPERLAKGSNALSA